jgi:hercynylcysteine S-oxide lyase
MSRILILDPSLVVLISAMDPPSTLPTFGKKMRKEFYFDPDCVPLNHGSYGACPRDVHLARLGWQELAERRPDFFMRREYMGQLDKCRKITADAINADVNDCVFVMNTTTGVNGILRSLQWRAGDALLCYSTAYGTNFVYNSLF